jgi:hypothetical protein
MLQVYSFVSELFKKLAPARGMGPVAISLDKNVEICDMGGVVLIEPN